jgi:hypothetical protein
MPRQKALAVVESIGRALPGVEVTTEAATIALKVRGRMFACTATHKSAEPDTLMVRMDFADRDALLEKDPDTYYLKEHYVDYPCVLVRLARVRRDALRDLLAGAHRFMSAGKTTVRKRSRGARNA